MEHFENFRLELQIGLGNKASKTECILFFPILENKYDEANT
jgi:hypothetical protein